MVENERKTEKTKNKHNGERKESENQRTYEGEG